MAVHIKVGPPVLTINRSSTFAVTDNRGEIRPEHAQGVFAADTRFVSTYHLLLNGQDWERLSSAATTCHSAQIYLVNPALGGEEAQPEVPDSCFGLVLVRSVEMDHVNETLHITNYCRHRIDAVFELEIDSDFADLFEVKWGRVKQREGLVTQWDHNRSRLSTTYRNGDFFRRFSYRIEKVDTPVSYANGRLLFPLHLDGGASWRMEGRMILEHRNGGEPAPQPPPRKESPARGRGVNTLRERWLATSTELSASDPDLTHAYRQSVIDMSALRLLERDLGPDVWVPAAGVPWFVTVFGRDSLIASLQNMMVQARFAEGALRTLAQYQARERDDWRDAQPGKIMHEVRCGELAHFNLVPQTPYYGTWDATSLYLITLHETWRWLADEQLVRDLLPTAERCLEWIDNWGDLDGDGFQEYRSFSSRGFADLCWKDSGHSVVYPDGSEVKQPKGTCELQGYVYAAKRGMAEVFTAFGNRDRAEALAEQATALKRRFNERFWMEDEGTFAFGLDSQKDQIKTVVSNPGHCLWTGIVDDDKAARLVERLLAADMWSGWGVRTLTAHNPAYNPYAYQRGAIWPHDNGITALGLKYYGFGSQANKIARGILDAAARFQSYRLPEVFAGLDRVRNPFPVEYRGANIPQAWASGSIFHLVQAILGLRADAPNGRLWVDPRLPDWLEWVELHRLRVGGTTLDLRFWREGNESRFKVLAQHGGNVQVVSGVP